MSKYVKKKKYAYDRPYKYMQEEIIKQFKAVHGNKYDYSLVVFKTVSDKIDIICSKHGIFKMPVVKHKLGQGCPKCAGRYRTTESLINEFREVHGGKYDYSKVEFVKMHEKVCIICPEHGEFWQTPSKHLTKEQGCPKCSRAHRNDKKRITVEQFKEHCSEIHNNKYDYSLVNFKTKMDYVDIICPKHGVFRQQANNHWNGYGCMKCGVERAGIVSKGESDIAELVESIVGAENVIRNDRSVLGGKEIDIYVPSKKIGVEYNGILFHSEKYDKDNQYHLNKTEGCRKKGVRLIHVFEDEYDRRPELVLDMIRKIMGDTDGLKNVDIYDVTVVKKISGEMGRKFFKFNHIEGCDKGDLLCYGAYAGKKLVAVMGFSKDIDEDCWKLARYTEKIGYKCVGVDKALFKLFIEENNAVKVSGFLDRRWTAFEENNWLIDLGFKLDGTVEPDYRYIYINATDPRRYKVGEKKNMNEETGYVKIWDCGLWRFEWNKKENN